MFSYLLLNIYSCNAYFNTKSKPPDSLLTPPPVFVISPLLLQPETPGVNINTAKRHIFLIGLHCLPA